MARIKPGAQVKKDPQNFGINTYNVYEWKRIDYARNYLCPFCTKQIHSNKSFGDANSSNIIQICPNCRAPTLFSYGSQFPLFSEYTLPDNVPELVANLYKEALASFSVSSFTSVVMLCRKILMNLSVENGAKEGLAFTQYIDFLNESGLIPPKGRPSVEKIRIMGNEANHTIKIYTEDNANTILKLTKYLLVFNYELTD
ncbi:MAG: DUF4145 domain-containing protein [Bdellovibrionaceae bacterium]|nr:DUF4145 domain-containing protein [Pseudobdellovibrionaceae bacterium]